MMINFYQPSIAYALTWCASDVGMMYALITSPWYFLDLRCSLKAAMKRVVDLLAAILLRAHRVGVERARAPVPTHSAAHGHTNAALVNIECKCKCGV